MVSVTVLCYSATETKRVNFSGRGKLLNVKSGLQAHCLGLTLLNEQVPALARQSLHWLRYVTRPNT